MPPPASGTSSVEIHPARRRDIPALVSCASSSTTEAEERGFGIPFSESLFHDVSRRSAAWREPNHVGGEEAFVALEGEELVGYVPLKERGAGMEFVSIDVAGLERGRGVGSAPVRVVKRTARERDKATVTLGPIRSAEGIAGKSLGWWLHQGYQVTAEGENAWTRSVGKGVNEIRLRKILRHGRARPSL